MLSGANTPQLQLGPHGGSGVNLLLHAPTVEQSQPRNKPAAVRGGVQGVSPWVKDLARRAEEELDSREESIPTLAPAPLGILFPTQRKKGGRPRTVIIRLTRRSRRSRRCRRTPSARRLGSGRRWRERQRSKEQKKTKTKKTRLRQRMRPEDKAENKDKDEAGAAPKADEASDDDK
jgi:hypothetical protein